MWCAFIQIHDTLMHSHITTLLRKINSLNIYCCCVACLSDRSWLFPVLLATSAWRSYRVLIGWSITALLSWWLPQGCLLTSATCVKIHALMLRCGHNGLPVRPITAHTHAWTHTIHVCGCSKWAQTHPTNPMMYKKTLHYTVLVTTAECVWRDMPKSFYELS